MSDENYAKDQQIKGKDNQMDEQTLKALAEYANEVCGALPGERVKYTKRDWTQDAEPVAPGELYVFDPRTIFKRQDRWKDKKIVETNIAFLGEKLKPLDELQPPKDEWELDQKGQPKPPWSETHYIGGIRERDGLLVHFAASSDGGRKAIGTIAQAVVRAIPKHCGKLPVVELSEDFYFHSNPQFGKVYYPVFLIVGWVDPPEAAPALPSTAPKTPQITGPAATSHKDSSNDGPEDVEGRWAPIAAYDDLDDQIPGRP